MILSTNLCSNVFWKSSWCCICTSLSVQCSTFPYTYAHCLYSGSLPLNTCQLSRQAPDVAWYVRIQSLSPLGFTVATARHQVPVLHPPSPLLHHLRLFSDEATFFLPGHHWKQCCMTLYVTAHGKATHICASLPNVCVKVCIAEVIKIMRGMPTCCCTSPTQLHASVNQAVHATSVI